MTKPWDKLKGGEKGQALILALILMLVGGLIITPMLSYMGSGLKVVKDVHETRMDELYAADAGVEDALWHLQDIERLKDLIFNLTGDELSEYWIPEDYTWPLPTYSLSDNINGKGVEVTVDYITIDDYTKYFEITSVATSYDDSENVSSNVTINSVIQIIPFANLLDNAVTSRNEVDGEHSTVNGTVEDYYDRYWPPADFLADFYLGSVNVSDPYPYDTIYVEDTPAIGPLYRDGDLTIINTGTAGDNITLQGTIYVTGKLLIGTTNKDFTLHLNNQTIFVEDASVQPEYALRIGGKTTITGSGCIIAVGDIEFKPNMATTPNDFVFVMSVQGTTTFQPGGDYYGSIAGDVEVVLQPGGTFTWVQWRDKNLNYPNISTANWVPPVVKTWEISLG